MKTKTTRFVAIFMMVLSATIGCTPKTKYERSLKRELATGVRNDSLFLGLYLGMTQKDFYTHCWNLNRKGLVKQGPDNKTVEFQLRNELNYPCMMNFYPNFVDGKIAEMPVKFTYSGWSPWNTKLSSDSLQIDILEWYKEKYGDHFLVVGHPKRGKAYITLNGNRRITIFKENDMNVWAIFSDMSIIKDNRVASEAPDIPGDTTTNAK